MINCFSKLFFAFIFLMLLPAASPAQSSEDKKPAKAGDVYLAGPEGIRIERVASNVLKREEDAAYTDRRIAELENSFQAFRNEAGERLGKLEKENEELRAALKSLKR